MSWSHALASLIPPEVGPQLRETVLSVTAGLTLLVIAGAIALVGWLIATLLSRAAQSLLSLAGLDAPAKRLAAGVGARPEYLPSRLVGYGVFWILIISTVIVALRVVGLDLGSSIVARLQELVPRIVAAAVVVLLGMPLALAVSRIADALLLHSGVRPSRVRFQGINALLVGFTALIALEQLGLAAQLAMALVITVVAAGALAAALAFGLGCRDLARDLIVEYLRASDQGTHDGRA